MKLGIINGWDEASFRYVAELGLHAVEFCCNHNYDSMEVAGHTDEIKALSERYDVAVGSIGRWGQRRIDEGGEIIPSALQHDKNLIDAASALGCPVFNVGCNWTEGKTFEENCEIATRYFGTLIDYAKGKNVKISVYNCSWENFVVTEKEWAPILGALPELGLKYDTSHCLGRGGDYLHEMVAWGSRPVRGRPTLRRSPRRAGSDQLGRGHDGPLQQPLQRYAVHRASFQPLDGHPRPVGRGVYH